MKSFIPVVLTLFLVILHGLVNFFRYLPGKNLNPVYFKYWFNFPMITSIYSMIKASREWIYFGMM